MGVPQYLCREIPQSFNRNPVSHLPNPPASAPSDIRASASSVVSPLYDPEFTLFPYSVNASFNVSLLNIAPSFGCTTIGIASPYFVANSKSRSSCAGTHITAPVPYSISSKFPTHTGTSAPLNGFTAYRPVKNPTLSAVSNSSAFTELCSISANFARATDSSLEPVNNFSTSGCRGARISALAP